MPVTADDVKRVADLARLAVSDQDLPALVRQLNEILGHMKVLSQVDTESVCGAAGVGDAALHLREDRGPPIPLGRAREQFAPEMRDGFFVVPRLDIHRDGDTEDRR